MDYYQTSTLSEVPIYVSTCTENIEIRYTDLT